MGDNEPIRMEKQNCLPTNWSRQWYPELEPGNDTTYNVDSFNAGPNIGFWGELYEEVGLVTDAVSAIMELPPETFS